MCGESSGICMWILSRDKDTGGMKRSCMFTSLSHTDIGHRLTMQSTTQQK